MPTARASARTAGSGRSIMSRWQWLSSAGPGSGSGSGGRAGPADLTTARSWTAARKPVPGRAVGGWSRLLQPGQLLVSDGGVKLGEQRGRRRQRGARPDRGRLPPGRGVVLAGDHRVRSAAVLIHLLDPGHARPFAGAAEHLENLL